jgi:hypothetical protein
MRWCRRVFLPAAITGALLAAGPAAANAERERMMLAALIRCDQTYATEPYASHVNARDLADLDLAHGALQAHLTRAFSAHESRLLVARAVDERLVSRPRTDLPASSAISACRRVVAGAINAYSWSRTWQAWIERN